MEPKEEEINFKLFLDNVLKYVNYYKSKWLYIVLLGILGAGIGILYAYTNKPVYKATLTFALEEKGAGSSGIGSIASQFGLSLGSTEGGAFSGDNLLELMKSRYLVEKTLLTPVKINGSDNLLVNYLLELNEKDKKDNKTPSKRFKTNRRDSFTRAEDSLLGLLSSSIVRTSLMVSKVDKKLNIISVKVVSLDEVFSKNFCEVLVKNVTDFYIETKTGKSKKNVDLLQSRVDSVKTELDKAMYSRAAFADNNFGLIRQKATVPKVKQEMNVQMLSTMYAELVKNLEFSKLSLMRDEPLIQVIDNPIYPLEKIKFGKFKGLVLGGFISFFLTMIFFTVKFFIKNNF